MCKIKINTCLSYFTGITSKKIHSSSAILVFISMWYLLIHIGAFLWNFDVKELFLSAGSINISAALWIMIKFKKHAKPWVMMNSH